MYHHGFRSVYRLNAHIVLVVKYRRKAINAEILSRLKQIITDTLKKSDCELLEFNGEADHIHLLIDYKPDKPLSTMIGNIKTVSSRLIRKEFPWTNLCKTGQPYIFCPHLISLVEAAARGLRRLKIQFNI